MVKLTNFDHLTTEIPQFWPWSWSKKTKFNDLTTAISKFWPWSWSKIFDHLTMTPGHRSNGQKFMVILPPPPLICYPFVSLSRQVIFVAHALILRISSVTDIGTRTYQDQVEFYRPYMCFPDFFFDECRLLLYFTGMVILDMQTKV